MNDTIIGPRPDFLDRTPGDVRPVRRQRKGWKPTKAAKAAAARDREKRTQEAARPTVYAAVKAGADTLGKIRKALDPLWHLKGDIQRREHNKTIRAALRFYIKRHKRPRIVRVDKRYYVEG